MDREARRSVEEHCRTTASPFEKNLIDDLLNGELWNAVGQHAIATTTDAARKEDRNGDRTGRVNAGGSEVPPVRLLAAVRPAATQSATDPPEG
jgi:hypothetical protein